MKEFKGFKLAFIIGVFQVVNLGALKIKEIRYITNIVSVIMCIRKLKKFPTIAVLLWTIWKGLQKNSIVSFVSLIEFDVLAERF